MSLKVPGTHPGWVPPEDCNVIAAGSTHQEPAVAIVLVERLRQDGTVREYATGEVYDHTIVGWGSGHYFPNIEDAHDDYVERITRGY